MLYIDVKYRLQVAETGSEPTHMFWQGGCIKGCKGKKKCVFNDV